ncbi:MAG: Nif3-like dinuclear metal center hexameric protein [Clostridia bacterium]|nr:Nif3-like dinuclear metal center hexameric protein [Clostridia bacterium]
MTTVQKIYEYIDSIAPFETAMSFDNVGLLVGNPQQTVTKVLVTLDVTSKVIDEAVKKGAELIISHHPVIFNPIKNVLSDSVPFLAAKNNITIISAHTNLDVARDGVNDSLAEKIGVQIDECFDEDCAVFGHLESEIESVEFAEQIKTRLECNGLRFTNRDSKIKNVVVSCGAGGDNIFLAKKLNADAFVTGEIKHHEIIFANENNIAVFDLGHYQSENHITEKLTKKLSENFPDVYFEKSEVFTDGIQYI